MTAERKAWRDFPDQNEFVRRKLGELSRDADSRALRADAMESLTCGYLSWVLLLGLTANALFRWWWVDSAAALVLVPILIREGREAVAGECCGCHAEERDRSV